jgi:hypothetical protein
MQTCTSACCAQIKRLSVGFTLMFEVDVGRGDSPMFVAWSLRKPCNRKTGSWLRYVCLMLDYLSNIFVHVYFATFASTIEFI